MMAERIEQTGEGSVYLTPLMASALPGLRRMLALAAICIAILAYGGYPASAAVSEESLELHKEARSYLQKGDVKSAVIQLKNAILADPDNVQARYDLAIIYLRGRDGPSAEKELKSARSRGMEDDKVLVPLARAYILQGKTREVIEDILPEGKSGKLKSEILAARGSAYASMKKLALAEEALKEAVAETPDSAFALVSYAQVLQALGKFAEAEAQIDRALVIEPENQVALIRKGALQQTQKDFSGAVETFGKAIALKGNNIPALLARAGVYIAANDLALARQDVDAVLERVPNNPFGRYLSATLLAGEKKYEEALDTLLSVMPALSAYPPALYLQASLDFAQGRIEQAQSEINNYLTNVPESPRGQRLLAAIHLRKQDPEKAIEILEPMSARFPEETRILTMLGRAYVAAGRNADATVVFEKVATQNPDDSSVRTRLALSRLSDGDSENAVKEFESILEGDPDETRASLLLVLTHLRERNFDGALAAANELKQRMPESPIPENFLGTIHIYKKDIATARRHFELALALQPDFTPASLNIAEIERNSGKVEAARERYKNILSVDEGNLQVLMRLSQMAFTERDTEGGIDWLDMAIKKNPESIAPRIALVNAYLQQKENQRALATAREAVSVDNGNVDALDALARSQLAAKKTPSAIATYRQIVKLVPQSAVAYHRFGRALVASSELNEAIPAFERAITLDPNNAAARDDLIVTVLREKGADAALKRARQMISENPDAGFGYLLEGGVLTQKGDHAAATVAYRNAQQRDPSSQTLARLYQSLTRGGKADEGRDILRGWLEENPDDTTIRFVYANALIRKRDYSSAIRENETLLEKFPENAVLINDLAWLYGETGDSRAIGYARKARELAPKSPAIADTLGWLLVRNGTLEEGVGYLKEASEAAPEQLEISYHYASALAQSGKSAEALKVLKDILDTGKPFGDLEDARALYVELVKK